MPSYNSWTKHGERGVIMEEGEEGDDIDDNYPDHFGDTFMEDAEGGEGEGEGEEEARDKLADDLGRTIADARRRCESDKERENLDRMLEDHKKSLYPGCDNGLKKLGCTLDLLKWKAREGVADSGFENLLKMLKNMFPKNNELSASTYESKKVVCPLGLEIRGDDPGDDVEGEKPRKRVPAKESALIEFLRERWEIFAWEPSDMPGIPRELAEHALNVDPTAKPVQQSMRRFSEPKRRAIGEEVNRLRKAGFIRELKESEWVANPVMVPKKDTSALRMCIDYTSLNKHCPKDHFPLPRIDQIVDSTAGCDRLSFLDAYSGYNQIKLKKEDQELTAFITPHGVFCYNVMTFGLKNAGATYQRCMQACLAEQIGRNIEVYIDDIVVKTKHAATLIDDLRETFDNLDRYKIKLNPKKCFFGVPGGQVLGYFISARGIEANPLKIKAILDMEPPKNLHQVQQLAGRLAALSRFIAKLGEKALPFYNLMKKSEKFEWTKEAQDSFDNLKKILSTSPVLVTPHEKETLLMYIATTAQVFSSVLVVE
ncbi:hypothetical protein QYE76_058153 [Lolium multiflorum]|uniref:Reverse transcriptase domain-containing protein n=1 Tax=Lolium multiflorum TaxID=4521 RepID=A0AAD8T5N3_LOLMU|nr:hypothetical protein QYE76_058153 [Lolium multiflorum]